MNGGSCRGLSLVELLVVCAILSLGAALAAPNWRPLQPTAPAEEAAQQLAADLDLLRQWTVNTAVGTADNMVARHLLPALLPQADGYQLTRDGAVCKRVRFPAGVRWQSPPWQGVRFDAEGHLAAGMTLYLQASKGVPRTKEVVMDLPGRIEVRNGLW